MSSISALHLMFQMSLSNLAVLVATSQPSCPFSVGLCDAEEAGREGGRDIDWSSASLVLVSRTLPSIGISPTDLLYMARSPCHHQVCSSMTSILLFIGIKEWKKRSFFNISENRNRHNTRCVLFLYKF